MPNLAPFEELFFQLTRSHLNNDASAVKEVLDGGNWAAFSNLAHRNGVIGLIYRHTRDQGIFPEQVKLEFQVAYRNTFFSNLDQLAELIKILRLFSVNGIKAIPLKGVLASELLFQDLGSYPSGDIDILVHPDDLSAVEALLHSVGYASVEGLHKEDLLINHYHLMFHNDRHLLEMHWNLTKRYFEVSPDFWWQDTNYVRWRNMEILELSPEKYILYSIFRLFDHCFYPFRFFILISGIIDTYSKEIRWDTLLAFAEKYKMRRLTLFTLKLVHDLCGTQIPHNVLDNKIIGETALKKLILSGIFKGVKRKHVRMLLYSSLLDRPVNIGKVLLGRIFPKKGELCLRYNLNHGSLKVWLYYLLNPVFLFFKKNT